MRTGDSEALSKLMPLVYGEIHAIASRYLRSEGSTPTMATTDLVHEAYLRLVDQRRARWQDRAHFFAVAAMAIRRILVDHARARAAAKRGGRKERVALEEDLRVGGEANLDILSLDEALTRLAALDPRKTRVVELRFFGGLSIEETAEALSVSTASVERDWRLAKAWLYGELRSGENG
ncbi:MAG: sigma-70 family RNA polymerase sigma factor [Planctomycetes bacterium]|nr:sigma-70 family RNA polymerase sigma factor [Planctomycetota bacterium]